MEDGQRQRTGTKVFANVKFKTRLSNQLQIQLCRLDLEDEKNIVKQRNITGRLALV